MTKRTLIIIITLAVVIVFACGYLFLNSTAPVSKQTSFSKKTWFEVLFPKKNLYDFSNYPESPRLTEFDSSKLNRIENRVEGYALVKTGNEWELFLGDVKKTSVKLEQSMISNKLWSISSIWAEQLVEENPADLSVYGLDDPYGKVLLADSEGKSIEIIFGNFTPSRSSRYIMVAGKPDVYTLSTYSIDNLLFSLDSVRDKSLAAYLDPMAITRFIIEPGPDNTAMGKRVIDIIPKDEAANYIVSTFTGYVMKSPYSGIIGVDSEKFGNIMNALPNLQIREYVDDAPLSLAPYGLDKPGRLYMESPEGSLDILFGRSEYGAHYAMYKGEKAVFILDGLNDIVSPTPFSLMDKFAMIFNIDNVKSFTVRGDGRSLEASIQGTGEDAIFHLNGRRCADKEFRQFYQAVIGLLIDAEYTGPRNPARGDGTDWDVEYRLSTPAGALPSIKLIPYNRDFYILEREGAREFLIARTQARRIFETADKMVYIE